MKIQCLLWDFGDTLCNEQSLWRTSAEWMDVYRSFDDEEGIGAAWSLGLIDTKEVVAKLASRMTLSESQIRNHLSRIDLFEFFPFTYAFFKARHLPQAIVTINPAEFRNMAQELKMEEVTNTIVISGEENTIDKGVLCKIAIQRMNLAHENQLSLLIDNKQSNLDAWSDHGGIGYHYTTDEAFKKDLTFGIDSLASKGQQET